MPDVTLTASEREWENREPSIGDTIRQGKHEFMWDGDQWVHSPDCLDTDPPMGDYDEPVEYRYFRRKRR